MVLTGTRQFFGALSNFPRNPPGHVARLFQEVINTHFLGVFKEIIFSIFEDHNTFQLHNPEGNVNAFGTVFKCPEVPKYPDDFEDSTESSSVEEHTGVAEQEAKEAQEEAEGV